MRYLISTILLLFVCSCAGAQTLFTHQAAYVRYQDRVKVIGTVSGNHHLLVLRPNSKPVLYVYDPQLNLRSNKELPFSLYAQPVIEALVLPHHYFLYSSRGSDQLQLWKVDEKGNISSFTDSLTQLLTRFPSQPGALSLSVMQNRIFALSHKYFPAIGKMITTQVEADSLFHPVRVSTYTHTYDQSQEKLLQATILDSDHLLLLKRLKREGREVLELSQIDLSTGSSAAMEFISKGYTFFAPAFTLLPADSSILVHSVVSVPLANNRSRRNIFLSTMDLTLQEKVKPQLLRFPAPYVFLNVSTSGGWLPFTYGVMINPNMANRNFEGVPDLMERNQTYRALSNRNELFRSIHFSLLDPQLRTLDDSLIANNGKYEVLPESWGRFRFENKSYLVFSQSLPSKSTGLVLLYEKNRHIHTSDIPVYNRYTYLLQQLLVAPDGSLLIPYQTKQEVGLMKLNPNEWKELVK